MADPVTPQGLPFLQSLLSDNSGGWSVIRTAALGWTVVLAFVWITACWHTKTVADIPTGPTSITCALWAIKGLQRFGEKDVPDPVVAAPVPIVPPVV